MLAARAVGYGYTSDQTVISDIDFRADDGEIVALVGPNGVGKSTLLALLEGRLRPTSGTVRAPDRRAWDGRLDYGYVAEHNPHYDVLTGRENALFFARAAGLSKADASRAVAEFFAELGLDPEADRPVAEYSFGARRKLALTEALAHGPGTALLDEPTVGLDTASTRALQRQFGRRADEGLTTIFAAHDLEFVTGVADRVVFLAAGRIAGEGPPDELVSALGDVTRFAVKTADPLPEFDGRTTRDIEGLRLLRGEGQLVLESDRGPEDLPRVVDLLASRGVRIRAITVHEAGLAEAFQRLTGHELGPPKEPGA